MSQDNKPLPETLEAEKPAAETAHETAQKATQHQPAEQLGAQPIQQQSEKPRAEASMSVGNAGATPSGSQPITQQPNKAAPQGAQQKR